MNSKPTRLVYSTDPLQNLKCSKCKELMSECICPKPIEVEKPAEGKSYKFVAVMRIEKAGRGGKTVTVIDMLPKSEIFLKELCTELKKKCGVGGRFLMDGREGVIEIQGDKRDVIRQELTKRGIRSKG